VAKLTTVPGNGASIGGLTFVTEQGWFAARPSGTEGESNFMPKVSVEKIISSGFKKQRKRRLPKRWPRLRKRSYRLCATQRS
jgi:phosphoglucomutase